MKKRVAEKRKIVVTLRAPTKTVRPVPAWKISRRSGIARGVNESLAT